MATERIIPGEVRIFLNHIYEFKKGVRNMVLYTMNREYTEFAIRRLENQNISYTIQEVLFSHNIAYIAGRYRILT